MTERLYALDPDITPNVRDDTREANDRIAAAAKRLHFVSRIPFICECSDTTCRAPVPLYEREYAECRRAQTPIVLSGHAPDPRA